MYSTRTNLSVIVAAMVVVQSLGIFASIDQDNLSYGSAAAAVGSPAAWLLYALFPLDWFEMFKNYEQDELTQAGEEGGVEGEESGGDTGGLRFDDVMRRLQIELEPYICPKLTKHILDALVEEEEYAREKLQERSAKSKVAPGKASLPLDRTNVVDDDSDEEETPDCLERTCVVS